MFTNRDQPRCLNIRWLGDCRCRRLSQDHGIAVTDMLTALAADTQIFVSEFIQAVKGGNPSRPWSGALQPIALQSPGAKIAVSPCTIGTGNV